ALSLLITFLFGITIGMIGGVILGSRRGASLLVPAAGGLLGAGARVFYGVYTRDDDGYLRSLIAGRRPQSGDPRGDDNSDWPGQELDR
ncbi:MAG TPA: hypothetical protein VGD91_05780, partial [Trebonia sp.]